MGVLGWLRVIDTVSGLAEASKRFRARPADPPEPPTGGPLGQLETRLAGVVVAALKEAFDRDRARLDLERDHLEEERRRADEALRLEMRRQAAERLIGQLRVAAVFAAVIWVTSALLLAWLPGMRASMARILLGFGWAALILTCAVAFGGHQQVTRRIAIDSTDTALPLVTAAPWLLVLGFALTAASLIAAL